MSRWNYEDSDDARLPDGMERVGYDADTQTYSYRDQDGSYWEGAPGARHGELHRSGSGYRPMSPATERELENGNREAWRSMFPFFLLVTVCLLALYRFLGSATPTPLDCKEGSVRYEVQKGDSCWAIANEKGLEIKDLMKFNEKLECSPLKAGTDICLPAGP